MKKLISMTAAAALLIACGEGDTTDETTDPGTGTPPAAAVGVDPAIAGNVQSVTFDATAQSLLVTMTSLDGDDVSQSYARAATYDVPGYIAFTHQDDPLDRFFTGYGAASADGSSQAVVVMDGGQFNRSFGGVSYTQVGDYTAPDSGLASYAGTYVGLLNIGSLSGTLPSGADAVLLPTRSGRVTGDIFMNVDFTDSALNGVIYNRVDVDSVGATLDTVFLVDGSLAADGSYLGTAEDRELSGIGSFAGVLGGTDGASTSGGIYLEGDFIPEFETEAEYGIFVMNQCGTIGEAAICASVDDVNE